MVSPGLPVYEVMLAVRVSGALAITDDALDTRETVTLEETLSVSDPELEPPVAVVPVMVMGNDPTGVAPEPWVVSMVSVRVQEVDPGLQLLSGLNTADAPCGIPDAESVTDEGDPDVDLTVTTLDPELPCTRERDAVSGETVKSKDVTTRSNLVLFPPGALSVTVMSL